MATHHSVADWDISGGWLLDTDTYVSSPSSMRFSASAGGTCKRSEVWNLSQGMIITYGKTQYDWKGTIYSFGLAFSFRNQATTGHGLDGAGRALYGYALEVDGYNNRVDFLCDGRPIANPSLITKPAHFNVWNKYRVTWWSDTGGGGLLARLEYWDGTDWVKMVNDLNHPDNKYKDSTVNRVSIASYNYGSAWFDDTEIWGP